MDDALAGPVTDYHAVAPDLQKFIQPVSLHHAEQRQLDVTLELEKAQREEQLAYEEHIEAELLQSLLERRVQQLLYLESSAKLRVFAAVEGPEKSVDEQFAILTEKPLEVGLTTEELTEKTAARLVKVEQLAARYRSWNAEQLFQTRMRTLMIQAWINKRKAVARAYSSFKLHTKSDDALPYAYSLFQTLTANAAVHAGLWQPMQLDPMPPMPGFFGTGGASTFETPPPQEPPAKSSAGPTNRTPPSPSYSSSACPTTRQLSVAGGNSVNAELSLSLCRPVGPEDSTSKKCNIFRPLLTSTPKVAGFRGSAEASDSSMPSMILPDAWSSSTHNGARHSANHSGFASPRRATLAEQAGHDRLEELYPEGILLPREPVYSLTSMKLNMNDSASTFTSHENLTSTDNTNKFNDRRRLLWPDGVRHAALYDDLSCTDTLVDNCEKTYHQESVHSFGSSASRTSFVSFQDMTNGDLVRRHYRSLSMIEDVSDSQQPGSFARDSADALAHMTMGPSMEETRASEPSQEEMWWHISRRVVATETANEFDKFAAKDGEPVVPVIHITGDVIDKQQGQSATSSPEPTDRTPSSPSLASSACPTARQLLAVSIGDCRTARQIPDELLEQLDVLSNGVIKEPISPAATTCRATNDKASVTQEGDITLEGSDEQLDDTAKSQNDISEGPTAYTADVLAGCAALSTSSLSTDLSAYDNHPAELSRNALSYTDTKVENTDGLTDLDSMGTLSSSSATSIASFVSVKKTASKKGRPLVLYSKGHCARCTAAAGLKDVRYDFGAGVCRVCVRGLRKALEKYNLLESRICTCRGRGRCTVCAWRRWEGHGYEDPALRED